MSGRTEHVVGVSGGCDGESPQSFTLKVIEGACISGLRLPSLNRLCSRHRLSKRFNEVGLRFMA